MNSCWWATRYLSKDNEEFNSVIQNVGERKIETIFEPVQAQISNLKYRDHETYGLEEAVDRTSNHRRNYSLLSQKIATQFTSKVYVSSDPVLCLGGKCQEPLKAARNLGKRSHRCIRPKPRKLNHIRISQVLQLNSCGRFTWENDD